MQCLQPAAVSFSVSVFESETFSSGTEVSLTCRNLLFLLFSSVTSRCWQILYLKSRRVPIFIPNDRFLFTPSTRLFYNEESISPSQSDLMDLAWDARAAPGSCWLAAFIAVIESECFKSWHFTSAWAEQLSCPSTSLSVLLFSPLALFFATLIHLLSSLCFLSFTFSVTQVTRLLIWCVML